MGELRVLSRSGAQVHLERARLEALGSSVRGALLWADREGYEQARKVWNGAVDKRPALIVRCTSTHDVVAALELAREHDLRLSVRGGGHNIAGKSLCDGGLTIDLSGMRQVAIDPDARTARVAGGALLGDLDRAAQALGLATTAGVVTHTGVGGLTLGGGVGRLARRHGLACDNLRGVEIVLADGRVMRASADENAELFWGVRGGGGNFGVVTSFELELHRVGPEVLGGIVVHALADAPDVLRFYARYSRDAPDELSTDAIFLTTPAGARVLALSVCYCGPLDEGERVLAPLRAFGSPVSDQIARMPYLQVQAAADAFFPIGRRFYWKSHLLEAIPHEVVDLTVDHFAAAPSPSSLLVFQQLGGAASRVPRSATAFWHRNAQWDNFPVSVWTDPAESAVHEAWVREWWEAMRPFSAGGEYVNNLGEEGEDRVRASYGGNYDRLAALKRAVDPTNVFQLNANVTPAR